jgi:DNA polymerase-3 subunit epsilon
VRWWRHPLPVLDLETTGFNRYGKDSIVQLSLVAVRPWGEVVGNGINEIVRPTTSLKDSARIHGITEERIEKEGREPGTVFTQAASRINRATRRGFPLVIHNALFDWPFLITAFKQHEIPVPWPVKIVDTKVLKTGLDSGYHRSGLEVALHDYGVTLRRGHHDAEEDCRYTRVLLTHLLRHEGYQIPLDVLQEVQTKIAGQYQHPYQKGELWPAGEYTQEDIAQLSLLV